MHVQESKGEKLFNFVTYNGIGFAANLGLSVVITDYFTHGHGLQWLKSASHSTAHALEAATGKPAHSLENFTYGFYKTNALMAGGHVVMAPIKWLEDHKRHVVHGLNVAMGTAQPITKNGEVVPLFSLNENELPALYEEQPKQTWANVIKRRAIGLAATTTLGTAMGASRQHAVEDFLTDKLIIPAVKASPAAALADNERFYRYAKLVSLDQFFTAITSAATYLTNGAKHDDSYAEKIAQERAEPKQTALG